MATTYLAEPLLEIDGQAMSTDLRDDLLQIFVEESLHLPGMFTLVIRNSYFPGHTEEQTWKYESTFQIGKAIKIGFGASTTEAQEFSEENQDYVLEGEITAIEASFTRTSEAPVIVRGYDISHRLHRGRYNRSFQNYTDTDIVKNVVGEVGIPTGKVEDTSVVHDYVFQENQTNMQFLRERAARNGFELYIQNGKLNFRKPQVDTSVELKWLVDLHSFNVRVSSSQQVKEVEVRGWDYGRKEAINDTATREQVLTETDQGNGSKTSSSFKGKPSNPKMIVVDKPVFDPKELKNMAQALFNELGGEFVHADAEAEGNAQIRPGRVIKLTGMGKYSGKYYVTESSHVYEKNNYRTSFKIRGLRGGDLLTLLTPETHLRPGQTFLVGIVTNNVDPQKMGRVRVKLPTVTEEHESNWARVVATGAGSLRGFDCLPEINDEVLVGFEHGDIHRPYVIGNVWNGKDKPPESVDDSVQEGKVRLRTIKTRTGHTLQFVEEDKGGSKKGIYLDSVYGHHIYCNDTEKYIEIKTKEGNEVRLDDTNKKILIKTANGQKLEMNDTSRKVTLTSLGTMEESAVQSMNLRVGASSINLTTAGITISSCGSSINIGASGVTISSPALVNINGSTTSVRGAVAVTFAAPIFSFG